MGGDTYQPSCPSTHHVALCTLGQRVAIRPVVPQRDAAILHRRTVVTQSVPGTGTIVVQRGNIAGAGRLHKRHRRGGCSVTSDAQAGTLTTLPLVAWPMASVYPTIARWKAFSPYALHSGGVEMRTRGRALRLPHTHRTAPVGPE